VVTAAAAATLLFGFQCFLWLRYGEWVPIPLVVGWEMVGFHRPVFEWVGIQIIVDWWLNKVPLTVALGGISAIFAAGMGWIGQD
jgi:hypothetical protein